MLVDDAKNYWFGNYNGGVNVHYTHRKKFEVLTPNPAKKNSLMFPSVISFFEDSQGSIWLGTDGGGLYKMNPKTNKCIKFKHQPNNSPLNSNVVTAIFQDSYGDFWFGTYEGGLNRLNKDLNKIKQYSYHPKVTTSLPSNTIWKVHEDSYGDLWILTESGIVRVNKKRNEFIRYDLNGMYGSYYDKARVSGMFEDSRQLIWLGTAKRGMYKYNRSLDKFESFDLLNDSLTKPDFNAIHAMSEDRNGNLWFISYEHMYSLNLDTKTLKIFTQDLNLPEMIKTRLLEDGNGNFWFGSNSGICKYNPYKNTIRTFTVNDGLPSNEINNEAALKSGNGKFYFGTHYGIVSFYPDSVIDYTAKPSVVFSNIYLFNKKVEIGGNDGILKKNINETDTIVLSYKQTVFTIKYAALNYQNAEHNSYAYKLEGFDPENSGWNYVGNERKANYTNLDHGIYIFHVKAANSDGYWNEKGRQLTIIITPPYWLTWWFKSLIFVLILIVVLGSHALRVRSIRLQKKKLKRLVQERTVELSDVNAMLEEMNDEVLQQKEEILSQKDSIEIKNEELQILNATKDRFFSIIAHDLRGPIGNVNMLGRQLWMKHDELNTETRKKLIKHIKEESSNSFTLLENLLEWSRSQLKQVKFEPVKFQLNSVINATVELLEPFALKKDIVIDSNIDMEDTVFADKNMIATVFRNIISNAIKFTESKGKVIIKTESNLNFVKVQISDNGIGISSSDLNKIFKIDETLTTTGTYGETGTGLGLILCKEFLEKNGSSIEVESTVGEGSHFKFMLPKNIKD